MKKLFFIMVIVLSSGLALGAIKPVISIQDAFGVVDVKVSPDGTTIVAAVDDGTLRQFHASSGRLKSSLKLPAAIKAIAFTADGQKIIAAANRLYLIDLSSNEYLVINSNPGNVSAIAAGGSGKTAVIANGSTLFFHDLISRKEAFNIKTPAEIYALAMDDTTQTVFSGSRDGKIRAYSVVSGKMTAETNPDIGVIFAMSASNNGIIAGGSGGVKFVSLNFKEQAALSRHTDVVRSVDITKDGRFSISGGDDGKPVVWDIPTGNVTSFSIPGNSPIKAAAIDPYFRYTVAGTAEMLLIQYTANKNELRNIYMFRDATATLDKVGYADGAGPFGKYITYNDGKKTYSFDDAANVVHQPSRLEYSMPQPRVARISGGTAAHTPQSEFEDTTPPEITVDMRGFEVANADEIRSVTGKITDQSGVAWAKIDDRALTLSADGAFRVEFTAKTDRNVIISAADVYGNTASKLLALAAQPAKEAGRKVALIIGINKYKDLPSLSTPEYDSRTLAQLMNIVHGYQVITLLGAEATRDAILTEINNLRRTLGKDDRLIIYYAGHGEWDRASGNAYWQPYDSAAGSDARWIHTGQLTATLTAFQAPVLVISDSCYSGTLRNRTEGQGSVVVITSGGDEPVADSGGGAHSLFTGSLIMAMRTRQSNAADVFKLIGESVKEGQKAEYHIISGTGDFFF